MDLYIEEMGNGMSPILQILQVVSILGLNTRDSASILHEVTDMVTVCVLGHNLWVREGILVM